MRDLIVLIAIGVLFVGALEAAGWWLTGGP